MWVPGRYTKVGIALTVVGVFFVMVQFEPQLQTDWNAIWCAFPVVGFALGWTDDVERRSLVFCAMIAHWVVIGLLVDRAIARRKAAAAAADA